MRHLLIVLSLALACSPAFAAETFDGRWEGVLIPNERCKDGTIQFEVKENRIASGFIQGTAPNGQVNKGSITSVDSIATDGRISITIGGNSPGFIAFTG